MELKKTLIVWTPPSLKNHKTAGEIKVGLQIDIVNSLCNRWSDKYFCSAGACYAHVQKMSEPEARYYLFNLAVHLICRDGMDPQKTHNALCEIKEYRNGLAQDFPIPNHLKDKFRNELNQE